MARNLARTAGIAGGVVALAFGVAACGDGSTVADLPSGVVARFGDHEVTADELQRAVDQQIAQAEQQGQTAPKKGSDAYDALRRQVLDNIKIQRLVEVESRKCGTPCKVTEADVTKELRRVRDQNFQGSQKKLDDFLKQSKLTVDDARRILRFSLQQPKLFDNVTKGVRFTAADARRYYQQNIAQFRVPAGRTARHILVKSKAEADAIAATLTDATFAAVAKKESLDPGSGSQGGDLGPIQRGQLVPEFEAVAFRLKDGEISAPVKTQFGWHIIQVHVTPARTTPFSEAKDGIVESQLQQKRQEAFATWRDGIIKQWDKRAKYAEESLAPPSTDATTTAGTTGG
ncbi:MAG: peptidylprolyl isomerase [Actinomycetota bacterium]